MHIDKSVKELYCLLLQKIDIIILKYNLYVNHNALQMSVCNGKNLSFEFVRSKPFKG